MAKVIYTLLEKDTTNGKWVRVWDEMGNLVSGYNREAIEAYANRQPYPDAFRILEGTDD